MSKVSPGEGTKLQVSIASTMTTIAQVVTISGAGYELAAIDKTHLGSTFKTKRSSRLLDPGTLSLSIFYDPDETTHTLITTHIKTPPADPGDSFTLIFGGDSDATPPQETFTGFFSKFEKNGMEVDGNLGADIEIVLTSLPTFTAGTP